MCIRASISSITGRTIRSNTTSSPHPGPTPSKIKFSIEGAAKTTTDKDGNIFIATGAGMVMMRQPVIYQQRADGSRVSVDGGFVLAKDGTVENHIPRRDVAIRIASYDHSRQLVIDPVLPILVYSSYLGGSGDNSALLNLEQFSFVTDNNGITDSDVGFDVALDSSNNAYVTGTAFSTDFPTPGGLQTMLAGAGSAAGAESQCVRRQVQLHQCGNARRFAGLVDVSRRGG